jgi:FAD/FMN-containing dehydrogenase
VTLLNPITVDKIAVPKTVDEIRQLVRAHRSLPISIGGARHSMGGQIATEGALFIDMREMNRIVAFSPDKRTITVEAGIPWRKIQEAIDPHDLSLKIMQSYANFTVGGSLSVNAHGRYVGQGSLIGSVQSIKVVLADGDLVEASRSKNSEVFYGCIGGYGGLGIIVEATLDLVENQKVERGVRKLRVNEYKDFFFKDIRTSNTAVFHNADLYPPAYDTVMSITWSATDRPVTVPDRLMPIQSHYWGDILEYLWISEMPFGKELRSHIVDPLRLRGDSIVWRNYEASYDARQLEPFSRTHSTYVLQEYFVPVERFEEFVSKMAGIFTRHHVNVINVSIRHAQKDPESMLAWAKEESFAFVVYYKQGVERDEKAEVGIWTRELIEAALSVGGSYYLPYQIHATEEQFHRAYPRAEEFFALKRKVDPEYRFRNKLWDRYYPPVKAIPARKASVPAEPALTVAPRDKDRDVKQQVHSRKGYLRGEEQTYLTLPEWYIVFSADEFADFIKHHPPSQFPYFRSIGQFWSIYGKVVGRTWEPYPFNPGYHFMILVIGMSYTGEYFIKGIYENTIGRLTEWLQPQGPWPQTEEDRYMQKLAQDYATFIHVTPWYEFPFWQGLRGFWAVSSPLDGRILRRWERTSMFTFELSLKTAYAWVIDKSTQATYAPEDLEIQVWVKTDPTTNSSDPRIRRREQVDEESEILTLPRYEAFTAVVRDLATQGVRFIEIAGNQKILMTMIAPTDWKDGQNRGEILYEWELLTQPDRKRVAITVAVNQLHKVIPGLEQEKVTIDHIFDY